MKKMNKMDGRVNMMMLVAGIIAFLIGIWMVCVGIKLGPTLDVWCRPIIAVVGAFFTAGMLFMPVVERKLRFPAILALIGSATAFIGIDLPHPLWEFMFPGCLALWLGIVFSLCTCGYGHRKRRHPACSK